MGAVKIIDFDWSDVFISSDPTFITIIIKIYLFFNPFSIVLGDDYPFLHVLQAEALTVFSRMFIKQTSMKDRNSVFFWSKGWIFLLSSIV